LNGIDDITLPADTYFRSTCMIASLNDQVSAYAASPYATGKSIFPEQEGAAPSVRQDTAPEDRVDLSPSSTGDAPVYDRSGRVAPGGDAGRNPSQENEGKPEGEGKKGADGKTLSAEQARAVSELQVTDAKVRAHEAAHIAAGAGLVRGGATYEMQKGPDGKMYAVGGEVSIDTSGEKNPEATVLKMQRVIAAALAPADPSPQDRSVAAAASQRMQKAMMEVMQESFSKAEGSADQPAQGQKGEGGAKPSSPYAGAQASSKSSDPIISLTI
jgi:hypothetical protein